MKIIYSIIISVLMVVTGQTFLKQSLNGLNLDLTNIYSISNIIYEPMIWVGLFLIAASSIIWLSVLSKSDISYAYPMFSLGYVAVALIGLFYFNEDVSLVRWGGIFTIVSGVILMSRS